MNITRNKIVDKVCETGNNLWIRASGTNFNKNRYDKYINHIKECFICQKGLEMKDRDIEILKEFS